MSIAFIILGFISLLIALFAAFSEDWSWFRFFILLSQIHLCVAAISP